MTVTITGWPLIVIGIIAAAYALIGLVWCVVWLLIQTDRLFDPERYERFRTLRNALKGKMR
ncbi:hypothetical protein [Curtobacterium sp. MCSS17_015]|uniref:hypothetical protein n=1 Tax=Curtobacterium sp. MCSS17_015 TaxID=2175666 RepID=UPI000DA930DA|nr:hypothetical protein [Curtobacterium sp. MCSS17_015]WIB25850.1 hypothetical protein DEJ18_12440 [Curtobacterium sp. MCSS17_015]